MFAYGDKYSNCGGKSPAQGRNIMAFGITWQGKRMRHDDSPQDSSSYPYRVFSQSRKAHTT